MSVLRDRLVPWGLCLVMARGRPVLWGLRLVLVRDSSLLWSLSLVMGRDRSFLWGLNLVLIPWARLWTMEKSTRLLHVEIMKIVGVFILLLSIWKWWAHVIVGQEWKLRDPYVVLFVELLWRLIDTCLQRAILCPWPQRGKLIIWLALTLLCNLQLTKQIENLTNCLLWKNVCRLCYLCATSSCMNKGKMMGRSNEYAPIPFFWYVKYVLYVLLLSFA